MERSLPVQQSEKEGAEPLRKGKTIERTHNSGTSIQRKSASIFYVVVDRMNNDIMHFQQDDLNPGLGTPVQED